MLLDEILNTIDVKEFYYIGESTNAKLYDVSYYSCSQDLDPFYFNEFCNIEFDCFKEYIKDVGADLEFIGRTSSFYFVPAHLYFNCYDSACFTGIDPTEKREMMFIEFLYFSGDFNSLGEMIAAGWTADEIKKEWAQFCADMVGPINKAWEYLDAFKLNQLDYFIEYLEAA